MKLKTRPINPPAAVVVTPDGTPVEPATAAAVEQPADDAAVLEVADGGEDGRGAGDLVAGEGGRSFWRPGRRQASSSQVVVVGDSQRDPVVLSVVGTDLTQGRVLTFTATPTGPRPLRRAARKAQAREVRSARARLDAATAPVRVTDTLPAIKRSRMWGRFGADLWGPLGPTVPKHVTSAARIGVMTPFVAPATTAIPGPVIGIETTSGQAFTFDPWMAGQGGAGLVSSPGAVVIGLQGFGKSMCVKITMIRLIGWGRQVIVTSDPKAEWVPIARRLGGQVVGVGPGTGTVLNLLAEGRRPEATAKDEWDRMVAARRSLALASVCTILRPDKPLTEHEQAALDMVVDLITAGVIGATVRDVVAYLHTAPPTLVDHVGAGAVTALELILGRLVTGSLGGMFDTESTVELDPGSPITVMDTSSLAGAPPELRALTAAATSSWVDAVLRSGDGRWRCVVSEEGWDELRNPALAQAMDERLRMAGHWRCSSWLIIHELADIEQLGDDGSAHRAQVAGIITKSPIKILYQQSAASMERLDQYVRPTSAEAAALTSLPQGEGIWHLGDSAPIRVRPVIGPAGYAVTNTDDGRRGY